MTWSIVARDPATGAFGVAVATRFFAVGALCPHADGGIGALATQALINPTYGPRGLRLLREGLTARQTVEVLTASDEDEILFLALESGADGYLLKRTKPADLRAAMLDVLNGGAPMTSEIARHVVASFRRRGSGLDPSISLSAREEETLVLLTKGYSNKEIADQLSLSIETVRSHLKNIYTKMHVRSRTEAVAHYMSRRPG